MIRAKIYLYNSEAENYKGTDYSAYLVQPYIPEEDITDLVDRYEFTLMGLPFREEFTPETKFIMEVFDGDSDNPAEHFDMVVEKDLVEQPILSDDKYFNHHIYLVEPSVIAQKRPVDNIAATYRLQTVNLTETPALPEERLRGKMTLSLNPTNTYTPTKNFGDDYAGKIVNFTCYNIPIPEQGYVRVQTLANDYNSTVGIDYIDISEPDNPTARHSITYLVNTGAIKDKKVTFRIPKCYLYVGQKGTRNYVLCPDVLPVRYVIRERRVGDEAFVTIRSGTFEEGLTLTGRRFLSDAMSGFYYVASEYEKHGQTVEAMPDDIYRYQIESCNEFFKPVEPLSFSNTVYFTKFYGDIGSNTKSDSETYYSTREVKLKDGYEYTVSFEPAFEAALPPKPYNTITSQTVYATATFISSSVSLVWGADSTQTIIPETTYKAVLGSATYINQGMLYEQSVPYSAYDLIRKAIVNSETKPRPQGATVIDVNNPNSPYSFYIDENFIPRLSRTQIVENFYNQKNLWEILLEAGKYIQAIPEIVFGDNNRFKITFNMLGISEQSADRATRLSVSNFRGIEDYISACSSYITNMVQINSTVKAWLVPKGDAGSDYLATNEEAFLQTPSPILEIVEWGVWGAAWDESRNDFEEIAEGGVGTQAILTPYIFEESVYKNIGINKAVVPNKEEAVYYSLGSNRIEGLNYRLPYYNSAGTIETTDYALKAILRKAYGIPDRQEFYINNYRFYLIYRTKTTKREYQVRPDLRKYLLHARDTVPYHAQFNNQEEVLVDSAAFGNNVYGKLIRTGNTNYSITEWVSSPNNLKHKGELYNIDGDLYYVATAKHTHYADHIVSVIEYSKDFNQLSPVIGIPSEPRFYEISERSSINRDVEINDYLLLTTNKDGGELAAMQITGKPEDEDGTYYVDIAFPWFRTGTDAIGVKFIAPAIPTVSTFVIIAYTYVGGLPRYQIRAEGNLDDLVGGWFTIVDETAEYNYDLDDTYITDINNIADIMFSSADYAKFVVTAFKGDTALAANNNTVLGVWDFYKEVISVAQPSSSENVLTYTWAMEDNFSAGDKSIIPIKIEPETTVENAYMASQAVRYTDRFGKAALFDFYLLQDLPSTPTLDEVRAMPESPVTALSSENTPTITNVVASNVDLSEVPFADMASNTRGLSLIKDCREAIRFNFNINLITDSDTFIPSAYTFAPNKQAELKLVFLSQEVNKSSVGQISAAAMVTPYDVTGETQYVTPYLDFNYTVCDDNKSIIIGLTTNISAEHFQDNTEYTRIRAVALIYGVYQGGTTPWDSPFIIAKNFPENWTKAQCLRPWLIAPPDKSKIFAKKQNQAYNISKATF